MISMLHWPELCHCRSWCIRCHRNGRIQRFMSIANTPQIACHRPCPVCTLSLSSSFLVTSSLCLGLACLNLRCWADLTNFLWWATLSDPWMHWAVLRWLRLGPRKLKYPCTPSIKMFTRCTCISRWHMLRSYYNDKGKFFSLSSSLQSF